MVGAILTFFAGIGVFLFSMKMLSSSLEDLCGNKIRKGFTKIGPNRFKNFGLGVGITALLQSSTASVTMTIGFVSTGMITLLQAIAINIGGNLGAAISPYLVSISSFSIIEIFCALAGIGAIMQLISKNQKVKKISNVLIAFALLFIGLELMGNATASFKTNESFIGFFTSITNPVLLILIGTAFTVLIQSSLGTIAIITTLVGTSTAAGVMSVESAALIIYGANLGSSLTTSFFASLNSNTDGKRIAIFHIAYNIIGVLIFGLLSLAPWTNIFNWITEPSLKLATINLTFNLVTSLILLPLTKPSMWLLKKILPNRKQKVKNELEIEFVEDESKAVAIAKASEKSVLMFEALRSHYNNTIEFICNDTQIDAKKISAELQEFLTYNTKLQKYLVSISTSDANVQEKNYVDKLIIVNKQIDRNARNCIKIIKCLIDENGKKFNFNAKILKNVKNLSNKVNDLFDLCQPYVKNPDCDFSGEIKPNFNSIIETVQEISTIKLNTKTNIMKNGFNSKISVKKNTSILHILNYITLISNNILDFAFACETASQIGKDTDHFEQIDIDDIETISFLTENLDLEQKEEKIEEKIEQNSEKIEEKTGNNQN